MKLEDQVSSLELAKKLKELGVKQESYFVWAWQDGEEPSLIPEKECLYIYNWVSAFTVAELGEMLPPDTPSDRGADSGNYYCAMLTDDEGNTYWDKKFESCETMEYKIFHEKTEADARAKMLIYLIENDLVKP